MQESKIKVNILVSFAEAKGFYFLALLTFISFLLYMFFIGQTVFRLVKDKELEGNARNMATEISELELRTLSLNDTISIDKAYERGFVEAKNTRYVTSVGIAVLR